MPPHDAAPGSPAAVITMGCGLLGVLLALNPSAVIVSLFFALAALAALPMALADRAGAKHTKQALLGSAAAVVALLLVGNTLLFDDGQEALRNASLPAAAAGR